MSAINFSPKLKPLFQLKTRYCILMGGRGGGKSFGLATSMALSTYDDDFNILYTRYTMTSAEVSVIPEFLDKMDMLDSSADFHTRRADVVNIGTGSRIYFRGLRSSSKSQVARLKSLHRVKTWVMDEAQELADEKEFDTIDDSLREKDADIHVILAFNQPDVQHWLYRRFFAEPGVEPGFNGIRGNVTYIAVTWEDNRANLHPDFIAKALHMKETNPDKYDHVYGVKFLANREGLIYKNWHEIPANQYPTALPQWWGMDWGYTDWPNAIVRMCYDPAKGDLYLMEIPHDGKLTRDAAKAVIRDGESLGYQPADCEAYCDPARPENIAECRSIYDISANPGVNRDKVGRIHYLQGFRVFYVGEHIRQEVETYSWKPDPHNNELFLDQPQDGGDHFLDAVSYGSTRLRRMGVNGEED